MVNVPGYKTRVLAGEYDYSGYVTSVDVSRTRDVYDTTLQPDGNGDRSYISGLASGTITLDGLLDEAAGASGPQIDALLDGSLQAVTVSPEGALVIGDHATVAYVQQDDAPVGLPLDGVVTLSSGRMGSGAFTGGVILKDFAAEAAPANFASVDHGSSTAFGSVANLHVTAFTGTNTTVIVADSTDDAVFADHITFTTVTGVTSERGTATGTVNQYSRVELSGTFTTITFCVSFARLKQ